MSQEIVFATSEETAQVQELFESYGMGLAGEIEAHVVLKEEAAILAGAMLAQVDSSLFHLLVFAVKDEARSQGTGSSLLQAMLSNPEKYCRDLWEATGGVYQITTVAKGAAAQFYGKNGFAVCDFSLLPEPYAGQCAVCADKAACKPVAMIAHYPQQTVSGRGEGQ